MGDQIPSMWRIELLHPQFVHFSVALLLTGSILWLIAFLFADKPKTVLTNTGRLIIILGTIISWVTVYTGSLADGQIVRSLCDPTVVERHEYNAYVVAYLFSGVSAVLLLESFTNVLLHWRWALHILLALLMATGVGYVTYTAHLGARIVYQQGGGVYQPSDDCSEFE